MKKPKHLFAVPLLPYGFVLKVVVGFDNIGPSLPEDTKNTSEALTFALGDSSIYVAFKDDSPPIDHIAHELFHVCAIVSTSIGHQMQEEDEPMSYLMGYMAKKVVEGLAKVKAKKLDKASKLVDNA